MQENMQNRQKRKYQANSLSIDIPTILKDLKAQWLCILLCAIGLACFSYAGSIMQHSNRYEVSTVVSVSGITGTSTATTDSLTTFATLLKSDVLRNKITADIGSTDYTISTSAITQTNILTISAQSTSPQTAFRALRSLMRNYNTLTDLVLVTTALTTLQAPEVSGVPTNAGDWRYYVLIGFALGALLCGGLIAGFSILRETVKNEQDMRSKVDATLLGTIPVMPLPSDSDRSAALINNPLLNAQYVENYYMTASRMLARLQRTNAKTVIVTSAAPNEGKTTCVFNLAIALAKSQKRVLVVGADFRNPAIAEAGKFVVADGSEKKPLSHMLENGVFDEKSCLEIADTGVKALFNYLPDSHARSYLENGSFQKLLDDAKATFDYIIVDSGPVMLVSDTEILSAMCDASVLVVFQDVAPIPVVNDIIDMLNREKDSLIGCIYRETTLELHLPGFRAWNGKSEARAKSKRVSAEV